MLTVEDDELLSTMLERILERAGYRVTSCRDGNSALAALAAADDVAAMITDIVLGPGMDGWQVARQARAVRPGLPVIAMSGYAPAERAREREPGLPRLSKPFRPQEMLDLLADVLGRQAQPCGE